MLGFYSEFERKRRKNTLEKGTRGERGKERKKLEAEKTMMKIHAEAEYMKETIAHKAAIKCLLRCGTIGCSSMYMLLLCTHYTQLGIE